MESSRDATGRAARGLVAFVYGSGLVQGVLMVAFAASSAVLRTRHGFTDTQYGSIFVPQMALAALGAIGSGGLARVLSLPAMLALSFLGLALSQAALLGSYFLPPGAAFTAVVAGTSLMGLGSGLSAAPLNTFPQTLFPARREAAVVAMHAAMGIGLTAGPLLVSGAVASGVWLAFPATLLVACLLLLGMTLRTRFPTATVPAVTGSGPILSPGFWLFVVLAVLYALAEQAYSNWAVLYLAEEKGLSVPRASLCLAAFWGALCAGRIGAGVLMFRVPPERVFVALPLLMATSSLLLPGADTVVRAALLFALAGLGCSAFYPLTVGLASRRFPGHVTWVTTILYSALVAGLGIGSFLMGALRSRMGLGPMYAWSAVFPLLALVLSLPALRWPARRP